MAEISLSPSAIIEQFKKNDVTHIVWLPDTETNFMYNQIISDDDLSLVPICREGESMPIAAGLWIGGKKPVVLIQNTGMFEAGDSIRGMGLDLGIPMVMVVGYRGWMGEGGQMTDSAGVFTEPILDAWGHQALYGGDGRRRWTNLRGVRRRRGEPDAGRVSAGRGIRVIP